MSITVSCNELFECFIHGGGGKVICDYKKKQCIFDYQHPGRRDCLIKPLKILIRTGLESQGSDISDNLKQAPHRGADSNLHRYKCDLSQKENQLELDRFLFDSAPFIKIQEIPITNDSIIYSNNSASSGAEGSIVLSNKKKVEKIHHYQNTSSSGFEVQMLPSART